MPVLSVPVLSITNILNLKVPSLLDNSLLFAVVLWIYCSKFRENETNDLGKMNALDQGSAHGHQHRASRHQRWGECLGRRPSLPELHWSWWSSLAEKLSGPAANCWIMLFLSLCLGVLSQPSGGEPKASTYFTLTWIVYIYYQHVWGYFIWGHQNQQSTRKSYIETLSYTL